MRERKTHCPRGHPYDEENTYQTPDGRRHCRSCRKVQVRNSVKNRRTLAPGWRDRQCPICGDGWFVNASIHVKKVHGISMPGLSSDAFKLNRVAINNDLGALRDTGPSKAPTKYWTRWAMAAKEEIAVGGFYVDRLSKRWRLTRQGASSRLMRLEERGLIERPRPRNRSQRSENDPPRRTHCRNGHNLTPENTYLANGARLCRICLKAKAHTRYEQRKARGYYEKP